MPFDREGTLRNAEKLLRQGKIDLAIAEYRSVVEDQPTDWNTSNTLGDLYFRSGQVEKAVSEYGKIADHLAIEGFFPKAVALYRKILKIKPDDEHAMWELGGLAARQGLLVDARANFLTLAERRKARGDKRGEAEARARLGDLDGADVETRIAGARARVELGEAKLAVEQLKLVAAGLQEKGKDADALRLWIEASRIDPEDPELSWTLAEMELRSGRVAEATEILQRVLAADPSRRDAIISLGCSVVEVNRDAGYECIELAAASAIEADEWASAAAAFNEFVARAPGHIPALMRLVEICVDGGLEATMHTAQAQLADAYLAVGAGIEARMIAEDLVAREPWEPANIERFRRALTLLGETDIDALIAERLSGQTPFTSTDFRWPAEPAGTEIAPTPVVTSPTPEPPVRDEPPVAVSQPAAGRRPASDVHAIDMTSFYGELAEQPEAPPSKKAAQEIDLSDVLKGLRKVQATGEQQPEKAVVPVESLLKGMRDEAIHDASPETAEQHFKLAGTYIQMGLQADAVKALEVAARSPRHRFRAGAMLAKACLDAGDPAGAIEWYGRAAEAPSPSPEALHALLYDLASVLEEQGESARALAVLLELQSEAGDYRDISARLEQLKVQMGS